MVKNIYVTKPYLPPLDEYLPYLRDIWASGHVTNQGPLHNLLEKELQEYLGVRHISLFSNATIALIVALKSLGLRGEVITTPFSFVATSHSILWNSLTPVFADIDPNTCALDINSIRSVVTENTTAIMPVHCYGVPCDISGIENIATEFNLKVIYDAAHAFGVNYNNQSILNYGDLSVVSFHATKIFSTFEGGAIISPTAEKKAEIDLLKNFGFKDELQVSETGLNGKMSEVSAAFGLLQLKHIDHIIKSRKAIADRYFNELNEINGITTILYPFRDVVNFSYFPISVDPLGPVSRDVLYDGLKNLGVYTRRYFYPLISEMDMYQKYKSTSAELKKSFELSGRILCLPIYPDLSSDDQTRVINSILKILKT